MRWKSLAVLESFFHLTGKNMVLILKVSQKIATCLRDKIYRINSLLLSSYNNPSELPKKTLFGYLAKTGQD